MRVDTSEKCFLSVRQIERHGVTRSDGLSQSNPVTFVSGDEKGQEPLIDTLNKSIRCERNIILSFSQGI